ncbi:cell wall-associated NlpC family hydrolase [Agrococcus sp. UYP10]|uniref:NlpC/P60 family protein n=1 Tax=Agrococcus sp. UYP10 TaxID=1756355 RepID=UPI0033989869
MTTSTEMTAIEPTNRKRFGRASFMRNARRVGVIAVAAAFATPLALPAFAASSDAGSQESLSALVAQDSQSVSGVVTAGERLDGSRLEVTATTPEELAAIRAELQAAADEERRQQEAAAAAAAAARPAAGATAGGATAGGAAAAAPARPAQASAGASGSAIASAALAQVGVSQDCVQLVRRSIAAAGLPYTGMGSLFNLGPTIPMSQASPGDVIYYSYNGMGGKHVAIYIGGGQAVHGGWTGNTTVVASVDIGGSAPVFIDIT